METHSRTFEKFLQLYLEATLSLYQCSVVLASRLGWSALELMVDLPILFDEKLEDISGSVFEDLIEFSDSGKGQFFTPRSVTDILTKHLDTKPGDTVYDPCCGSGNLLLGTLKDLRENGQKEDRWPNLFAGEADAQSRRIATMNLVLQGAPATNISQSSEIPNQQFDCVMTDLVRLRKEEQINQWFIFREFDKLLQVSREGGRIYTIVSSEDFDDVVSSLCQERASLVEQKMIFYETPKQKTEAKILVMQRHSLQEKFEKLKKEVEVRKRKETREFKDFMHACDRKTKDEFQRWFSEIMQAYDTDFVPTRSHSGDLGCDSFFFWKGLIVQCYAPESATMKAQITKIKKDFETAKKEWAGLMEGWIFVYNHPSSTVASQILREIKKIEKLNPDLRIEPWGRKKLWFFMEKLAADQREYFLNS
jgi:ubiquinone/menaquinone biosynthesis C-methylase UbiE